MDTTTTSPRITRAPATLSGWMASFDVAVLPVLASTARAIEDLRSIEDGVDAHGLAEKLSGDPLLTVKLLATVARLRHDHRGRAASGDAETVTEALVMLGIPPFFRVFGPQPAAQSLLDDVPQALAGFDAVLRRSNRAASFATGFAVHRMDHDAALIHEAALTHDFAELLLWLRAPELALQLAQRLHDEPGLRSATAQRQLLHITLDELQHALMTAWRLPAALVQITDEQARLKSMQRRTVQLAVRVARHSADGWDDPALPDDIEEIAELLQLSPGSTERLLHQIDGDD